MPDGAWVLSRVTDRLYRAPQPRRSHLAEIKQAGIKTIFNLRGLHPFLGQERWGAACVKAGLAYRELPALAADAPQSWMIQKVLDAFAQATFPVLIHCKAGADRTGFAAALFLHYHEGWDIAEAARHQLTPDFGHDRHSRTGILDAFFAAFATQSQVESFDQWWRGYDPDALRATFEGMS